MPIIYLLIVFSSSILIDFDHYVVALMKTKKWRLTHAFDYHKKKRIEEREEIEKGIRRKGDFHLFHTVEFHLFLGMLTLLWTGFFYIFIGMIFHSLLDVFSMITDETFHRREYFLFNWLRKRF